MTLRHSTELKKFPFVECRYHIITDVVHITNRKLASSFTFLEFGTAQFHKFIRNIVQTQLETI